MRKTSNNSYLFFANLIVENFHASVVLAKITSFYNISSDIYILVTLVLLYFLII